MATPPTRSPTETTPTSSRRAFSQQRILCSARSLIDEGVPWPQVGIRQIAERAEISRTAFYDFYGSKNEVLEHLIRELHERLVTTLEAALEASEAGAVHVSAVAPALAAVDAYASEHGYVYRAFLAAGAEDEGFAELWTELLEAYTALLAGVVLAVREASPSAPRTVDATEMSRALILMTERCVIAELGRDDAPNLVPAMASVWELSVWGCAAPEHGTPPGAVTA